MSPRLIVSLDFELFWGVQHSRDMGSYRLTLRRTGPAIRWMLGRFEEEGIRATWATVGLLGCGGPAEATQAAPAPAPAYRALPDPYRLLQRDAGVEPELLFAPELVEAIRGTPGQELATHTFGHLMCSESGITPEDLRRDLRAASAVAERWGVTLWSIVFPSNQYSPPFLEVCRQAGLTAFRGNPPGLLNAVRTKEAEPTWVRAGRLLDAHVPVRRTSDARLELYEGLVNVPASRFLRLQPTTPALRLARLRRVLAEMRDAARRGADYHLWWHPHNLGVDVAAGRSMVEGVLRQYRLLKHQYGMTSATMGEVAQAFLARRDVAA